MKTLLKGMIGIAVGSTLLPAVLGGIASSGMKFSSATQSLMSVGFMGHTASLIKKVRW